MFQQRDLIIGISGASGVGKTTLLRNIEKLEPSKNYEIRAWMPKFVTTRLPRASDRSGEIFCISSEEFKELEKNDGLIVSFKAHGYQYGLCQEGLNRGDTKVNDKTIVFIQVVHPDIGGLLKEKLFNIYDIKICMLVAQPSTVYKRLKERNDNLSTQEILDRQQLAQQAIPNYVDYVVDAEQPQKEVTRTIIEIIENSLLPVISDKQIKITSKEKEIIQKVIELGKKESIKVCAFGGLAANIYGSNREITDLDLITDCKDFSWLTKQLKYGGMNIAKEMVAIGRVDIRRCPIKIGDQNNGQFWSFDDEARQRLKTINLDGLIIDVLSVEDKIVMKAILQRGEDQGKFDIFDLKNMLKIHGNTLDKNYIRFRANKCNALVKVEECLASHGFLLNI